MKTLEHCCKDTLFHKDSSDRRERRHYVDTAQSIHHREQAMGPPHARVRTNTVPWPDGSARGAARAATVEINQSRDHLW